MRLKDIQHPLCCYNVEKNIYRLINSQMLDSSINSIYCGRIQYTYNKMIYLETGKEVHSQEELIKEVNKWASSLEYPADELELIPDDRLSDVLKYVEESNEGEMICHNCESIISLKLHPYAYDAENNDVVYASRCPNCGEILYSKD